MGSYITEFRLDPAENSAQFQKRLTNLVTGAALQDVDTKDGVAVSTV
ncbi:hypothetical protein OAM69_00010 [bacterium]|nr:hypothetical protein [bacterium]